MGWYYAMMVIWYGVPLALILALSAAIIYFTDRKTSRSTGETSVPASYAVAPPSMTNVWPVTKEDSEEAR